MERHITKMKKFYNSQRDYLIHCLTTTFSTNIHVSGYSTGFHLIVELKDIKFSKEILKRIEQFGVKVYPVEDHSIEKGKHHHQIILGFGHLTKEDIEKGIFRLHQALYNTNST